MSKDKVDAIKDQTFWEEDLDVSSVSKNCLGLLFGEVKILKNGVEDVGLITGKKKLTCYTP
jgi:hypothetical protein